MMNPTLVSLYKAMKTAHEQFVQADGELRRFINASPCRQTQADTAYALRETAKFADDVRKRCNELQTLAEKLACVLAVAEHEPGPIKTDHCTATPNIKTIVTIPRQSTHPEEFAKLMEFLGVQRALWDVQESDEEDAEKRHAVVKPHWPGLVQHLNELLAMGHPLPPGIDPNKTYPEYKLIIRRKKGVSE